MFAAQPTETDNSDKLSMCLMKAYNDLFKLFHCDMKSSIEYENSDVPLPPKDIMIESLKVRFIIMYSVPII